MSEVAAYTTACRACGSVVSVPRGQADGRMLYELMAAHRCLYLGDTNVADWEPTRLTRVEDRRVPPSDTG